MLSLLTIAWPVLTLGMVHGQVSGFDTRASYHIQPEPHEREDEEPGRAKDGDENTTHEIDGSYQGLTGDPACAHTTGGFGMSHLCSVPSILITGILFQVAGTLTSVIKNTL
ncbi:hypothetical protein EDB83DRAFT_989267 [Lactarius deliciosus]|nr:hypothetical protein EDB83DRAFT_989267 [Lactarius deliciosus]